MTSSPPYTRFRDYRANCDYNSRQVRYGNDRSDAGRYPIAERYREERDYNNKLYNNSYNDSLDRDNRYNDHLPNNGRFGNDGRRYYNNRDDFDRPKRERPQNDFNPPKDDYSHDLAMYRDRGSPRHYGDDSTKDQYNDYLPPGVDEYDDYNVTPKSRDRNQRRGREADHDYRSNNEWQGRGYRSDRERSPLRSDGWDRHKDSGKFDERTSHDKDERQNKHDDRLGNDKHDRVGHDKYDDRSGHDYMYDRCGENWMSDTPSNTIIMRGLPVEVDETDILKELNTSNVAVKDVRLMRKRATGVSRGFAFVEFKTTSEACNWMDESQGRITIKQRVVSLCYSCPKFSIDKTLDATDWTCSKCCARNFKRRDQCYICGISRGESDRAKEGDGFDHIGNNPCNTLIFRGLDALTTDATLKKAIRLATKKKPKNTKVMTDSLTGTSLGYAFAEFASVKDTAQILEQLQHPDQPFEVDGKLLLVAYAKNTFSTIMATFDNSYYQAGQASWTQQQQWDYQQGGQYYDYNQYYQQKPRNASKSGNSAVAQAAIQQAQAANTSHSAPVAQVVPPSTDTNTVYPTPDISQYQYDHTSGYYYDASTGLYYDAKSQYYYNNQTGQFLYWSAEKSTYIPVSTEATPASDAQNTPGTAETTNESKKDKEKKEKAKMAKKIAKDMEKWAKSQNSVKNPASRMGPDAAAPAASVGGNETSSKSADAGFSLFASSSKSEALLMPPPPLPTSQPRNDDSPGLVASYGGDSDDDDAMVDNDSTVNEDSYLDWNKLICQMCKRQFNSREMLQKHKDLSDLHKQNLAKLIMSKESTMAQRSEEKYRDRAAERRQKYGAAPPPAVEKKINFPPPVDIRPPGPANQSAVANKMMQKMGWAEGQGLGKGSQGIVDPIQAKIRSASAGLGARGASYDAPAGVMYREAGKLSMFARFKELD